MKKTVLVISAVLLCVALAAGVWGYSRRVVPIDFSADHGMAPVPQAIEVQIPQEQIESVFARKHKIYKLIRPNIGALAKKLLPFFEMEGAVKKTEKGCILYEADGKELEIKKDGTFSFRRAGALPWEPMLVSPEAMAEDMLAQLKRLGVVPDDFYVTGTKRHRDNGGVTTAVSMDFSRKIEGYPVYLGSQIWARQDIRGLESLEAMCLDYKEDRMLRALSLEEACEKLKTDDASLYYTAEVTIPPEKVVLQSVQLVYFDTGHLGGTHILPCYRFEGVAYASEKTVGFTGTVMAIK